MSKAQDLANRLDDELEYDHDRDTIALLNKAAAHLRAQDEAIRVALDALMRAQTHLLMPADCEAAIAKLLEVQG